jgi:RNA-splicing ligase RtcB
MACQLTIGFAAATIHAIIETVAEAGIAKPVAELRPMMTIKGRGSAPAAE